MATTDSRPVPIKNTAFRVRFGIFKNDGTLITGATGLDSEISKDDGSFADCTNEATEISQGVYYLDLTSTEMNADGVMVIVKSTSTGAVPVLLPIYPQESGDIKIDVQSFGGSSVIQSGGRPEVNASHIDGVSATALRRAFENMTVLTINGTPTNTTCPNSTLTNSNNDKYKGRPLYYLTGNLAGEVVEVTAYNGTTKTLTHTAAPSGLSATAGDLAILA